MINPWNARVVFLILGAAGLRCGSLQGQVAGVGESPRLSLGITSGTSESEVEVPFKLALPARTAIGRIEAQITFPTAALSFEKVAGYRVTQNEVKVEAKLQEAPGKDPGDQRVLALSVETGAGDRPLPEGVLASVVFKVARDTKPDVLALDLQAKAFALSDRREINPVEVYGGRISIQTPEAFYACFFYMH